MSIVILVLAVGLILIAFAFYGRTRDVYGETSEKQRWTLLMGTWRDSLIITVLYTSQGLLYRFAEFQGLSSYQPNSVFFHAQVAQPVLSMIVDICIFTIAIMRVIVISRWLAAQKNAG